MSQRAGLVSQTQNPRMWFSVDCLTPSVHFHPRTQRGQWLPPRPLHSNVLVPGHTTGRWFEQINFSTREVARPDIRRLVHYKTFSFYFNDGHIWIYPCDASRHKVGDGTGNARVNGTADHVDQSSGSDDDYRSDDRSVEDWIPLNFQCPTQGDNSKSYATTRALRNSLPFQRADQASLLELLPDQYHAHAQNRRAAQPLGGLVGELPILIALVAFSVTPDRVDRALVHCLRHSANNGCHYQRHYQTRGQGWTDGRGMVVRVYNEPRVQVEGSQQAAQYTPAQKLHLFELGGYGKFIV